MPAPSRAISESAEASPAAPQSCSDSTRPPLDELDRDLDQLLAGERIADLHDGRLSASPRRAPGSRAPTRRRSRRGRSSRRRARRGSRARSPSRRQPVGARARRTSRSRGSCPVRLVEDGFPADVRHADGVAVAADPGDGAAKCVVGAPNRGRRGARSAARPCDDVAQDPADPVAAPWNGSTADGWLCAPTLNATASPRRGRARRVLAGPCSTRSPVEEAGCRSAPSACSRSAPTRGARRRPARNGSARGRGAPGFSRPRRRVARGRVEGFVPRPASGDSV
jgi:hypothetical protein